MSRASGSRIRKTILREGVDQIERLSPMQTGCTTKLFEFEGLDRRAVVAGFDGGDIISNAAGGLLLGLVDRGLGLVRQFADCFPDRRNPSYVEHQVEPETIVGQRIFGLVLGYEDLNPSYSPHSRDSLTGMGLVQNWGSGGNSGWRE
jgi:hypothetical protein